MKQLRLLAAAWCLLPFVSVGAGLKSAPASSASPPVELIADTPFLAPSSTLEFRFKQPMVKRDEIGLTAGKSPVVLAPSVPGKFTWLSRSSGVFVPSSAWPLGGQFTVTLDPGLTAEDGKPISGSFRATLRTPPFGHTAIRTGVGPDRTPPFGGHTAIFAGAEANRTAPFPRIMLAFNLAVDLNKAEDLFQFVDSKGLKAPAKVRYATGRDGISIDSGEDDWEQRWHDWEERWRQATSPPDHRALTDSYGTDDEEDASTPKPSRLVVTPAVPLTPGGVWRLELKRGLRSRSGQTMGEPLTVKLGQVAPFGFLKFTPSNDPTPRRFLTVEFAHGLAPDITTDTASKFFRVDPQVPNLRFSTNGSELTVHGDFELGKSYTLEVDPAVISADGLPFQGNRRTVFRFAPVAPRLDLPSITGHQVRSGLRQYDVFSTNLKAIKVRADLVPPAAAPAAVKAFEKYYLDPNRMAAPDEKPDKPFKPMPAGSIRGKTVFERTIDLPAGPLDARQRTALDWDQILGAHKGGVIFLTLEGVPVAGVSGKRSGAQCLVQLTDLGVLWKKLGPDLQFTVFSMTDGKPLPGATIALRTKSSAEAGQGQTDAQGTATLSIPSELASAVVTLKDDAIAFNIGEEGCDNELWGRTSNWSAKRREAAELRGLVFTDRPLYRPGETVHVKGIVREVRDSNLESRIAREGVLKLHGPHSEEISATPVRLNERGSFDLDLPLKGVAPGSCSVSLEFGEDSFQSHFELAEVQPNAFEVKVSVPERLAPGAQVEAKVAAKYLFGAPLTGANVKWRLSYERESFRSTGFSGWHFGGEEGQAKALVLHGEGKIEGPEGLAIRPRLPDTEGVLCEGQLFVEVTDLNQQTLSESATFSRDATDFYLGLSLPKGAVLKPGGAVPVQVIAIRPDGTPLPEAVEVKAELISLRDETERVRGADQSVSFNTLHISEVVASASGRTLHPVREDDGWEVKEGASVKFLEVGVGQYRVRVTARDAAGRFVSSYLPVQVGGPVEVASDDRRPMQVDLVADKTEYRPGDTARLLVKTPIPGEALVSIERDEQILRSMRVKLEGHAPVIEVPLAATDIPNVHVSVVLICALEQSPHKIKTAEYRHGTAMLAVSDPAQRLQVELAPARDTVTPGEDVETQVLIRDGTGVPVAGAEVTFFAVDDGLLALTGYERPDPRSAVDEPHSLRVLTGLSLVDLLAEDPKPLEIPERDSTVLAMEAVAAGPPLPPEFRQDFAATACWFPSLTTDAAGKVSVRFPAPDSVTRYRIVAVAHDGAKFGSAESFFSTRKPLMVLSSLGLFGNVGDTLVARAVVRNDTGADADTEVGLDLDLTAEHAPPSGNTKPGRMRVAVKNGESCAVDFPVRLLEMGRAQWTWSARAAVDGRTYEDRALASLKVGSSIPVLHETYLTDLRAASTDLLEGVNPQLLEGAGALTVTVANSRLAELRQGASYLLEYPYGCAEQTASSLIPWALLPQLSPFVPDLAKEEANARSAIFNGLVRFGRMQTSEGGISYWPDARQPSLFASAYTALVLHLVSATQPELLADGNYAFSDFDEILEYLSHELRGLSRIRDEQRLADCTLAVYALSASGKPQPASHDELYRRRKELSRETRGLLALAIMEAHGSPAMVGELLNPRAPAPETSTFFGDGCRDRAIQLLAWTHHNPKSPEVARLVKELLAQRKNGQWGTTQANAWALMALAKYYSAVEDGGKPVQGALTRRGAELPFHMTREQPSLTETVAFTPTDPLQPVTVKIHHSITPPLQHSVSPTHPGLGTLFGETNFIVRPLAKSQPRQDRGYAVSRSYRKVAEDGSYLDASEFKVGDRVLVTLRVETTSPGHFIAIDDPLPSIFEPINPALRGQQGADSIGRDDWISDHRETRADRVIYFCDHLPAGAFTFRYTARVRAAGTATAGPTKVEEMYRPERFGLGESVSVTSKPSED